MLKITVGIASFCAPREYTQASGFSMVSGSSDAMRWSFVVAMGWEQRGQSRITASWSGQTI
jgi:hypothetical protein